MEVYLETHQEQIPYMEAYIDYPISKYITSLLLLPG